MNTKKPFKKQQPKPVVKTHPTTLIYTPKPRKVKEAEELSELLSMSSKLSKSSTFASTGNDHTSFDEPLSFGFWQENIDLSDALDEFVEKGNQIVTKNRTSHDQRSVVFGQTEFESTL